MKNEHSSTNNQVPGRWYSTDESIPHHWEGVCSGCGDSRPAVMLSWRSVFGKEGWCCRDRRCSPAGKAKQDDREILKLLRQMRRNGEI